MVTTILFVFLLSSFHTKLFVQCSANGASACYILSDVILGRNVVARWFPERVELWKGKVRS